MPQLPALSINPRDSLIDFSPVNNAIDGNRRYALQLREDARQAEELDINKQKFSYQRGRDARSDSLDKIKRGGETAIAIQNMRDDDPAKAAAWQRYLKVFGDGDHSPEELDFRTGPKLAAAMAGQYLDPRDSQMKDLKLQGLQSDLATSGIQRQKMQMELDQSRGGAGGKVMEVGGSLVRLTPDGKAIPIYQPQSSGQFGPYKDAKQMADVEEGVRKEYAAMSKPYMEVRDAYARVKESASVPTAAGDLALIYNYMKMLDPGSVVRETEFAIAAQAGSYGDRIKAAVNKIISGERLADDMRRDFVTKSEGLMRRQEAQAIKTQGQYKELSKRKGLDPANTVLDFTMPDDGGAAQPSGGGASHLKQKYGLE